MVVISVMVPDGESRRLGNTLGVYAPEGFTNEEALTYLRGILESAAALAPLAHTGQTVEDGQKAGLGDGLAQVSFGAE